MWLFQGEQMLFMAFFSFAKGDGEREFLYQFLISQEQGDMCMAAGPFIPSSDGCHLVDAEFELGYSF